MKRTYYVAYEHEKGIAWVINVTDFDLNTSVGITSWIEDRATKSGFEGIVPVFWKELEGE